MQAGQQAGNPYPTPEEQSTSHGQHNLARTARRAPARLVVLLCALALSTLLGACGGPGPQLESKATIQPTAAAGGAAQNSAPAEGEVSGGEREPGGPLEEAVLDHIARSLTIPYRNVHVEVLSEDDVYATVQVSVELRESESVAWEEHQATYKLRQVGEEGEWSVYEAGSFVSALAPQKTATAQAELQLGTGLNAIHMLSAHDGLALGGAGQDVEGSVVLRYKGAAGGWSQTAFLQDVYLEGLFRLSPDEAWAAGYKRVYRDAERLGYDTVPLLVHYTGGEWVEETLPEQKADGLRSLRAVFMLSPQEGFAAGDGGLLYYSQGRWQNVQVERVSGVYDLPMRYDLLALQMQSPQEGWAAGVGVMLRYEEGTWKPAVHRPQGGQPRSAVGIEALSDLSVLPGGEGWATALNGTTDGAVAKVAMLMQLEDGQWTPQWDALSTDGLPESASSYRLHSLELTSPDQGWAVGAYSPLDPNVTTSLILRYDGKQWRSVAHPPVEGGLLDLDMAGPDEGWAVSWGGVILHYTGGEWSEYKR